MGTLGVLTARVQEFLFYFTQMRSPALNWIYLLKQHWMPYILARLKYNLLWRILLYLPRHSNPCLRAVFHTSVRPFVAK